VQIMAFHDKLRNQIHEKRLSVLKLSKMSGIPNSTLTDWASGKAEPPLSKAVLLAKTLGCSINDLIEDDEEHSKRYTA